MNILVVLSLLILLCFLLKIIGQFGDYGFLLLHLFHHLSHHLLDIVRHLPR